MPPGSRGVELLLLHGERRQKRWLGCVDRKPPWCDVPGMLQWDESTLRKTFDMLERLSACSNWPLVAISTHFPSKCLLV